MLNHETNMGASDRRKRRRTPRVLDGVIRTGRNRVTVQEAFIDGEALMFLMGVLSLAKPALARISISCQGSLSTRMQCVKDSFYACSVMRETSWKVLAKVGKQL